ncbi:pantetheine-phosphate adenylyltransferase [Citroniella saccharovorans]|uniref:Phosphopantetheine adenylyltransferase n=1 Tax=Citroniella saccharovorans TaxID=2053367 RepID=A0AAW9MV28_9FIRM|nr:pantetheine-phosphate adenylyltransferase [Citroniella saccharovorans]MEB3429663.1 pantetheine-phosphate adenylyltransferase [Citroniella saccharovorans]
MRAIYPGSFDPITYGHLDIIERCSSKFNSVLVAVLNNNSKKSLFDINERVDMIKEVTSNFKNVEVKSFDGLMVDFAKLEGVDVIIRGLRAVSDYEYELQMSLANKTLNPNIETLFLVSSVKYLHLSSSLVKEIASYKGDISSFVPPQIEKRLLNKLNK